VGGGDTAQGGLPRLVFPPTGDDLKCPNSFVMITILDFVIPLFRNEIYHL